MQFGCGPCSMQFGCGHAALQSTKYGGARKRKTVRKAKRASPKRHRKVSRALKAKRHW